MSLTASKPVTTSCSSLKKELRNRLTYVVLVTTAIFIAIASGAFSLVETTGYLQLISLLCLALVGISWSGMLYATIKMTTHWLALRRLTESDEAGFRSALMSATQQVEASGLAMPQFNPLFQQLRQRGIKVSVTGDEDKENVGQMVVLIDEQVGFLCIKREDSLCFLFQNVEDSSQIADDKVNAK